MLNLTLKGVEVFIEKAKTKTQEPYWDNYDLLIWKENSNGFTSVNGSFKKNKWGIVNRVSVNNQGIWKLPVKYVKYFK
jgi:hypothetical protein